MIESFQKETFEQEENNKNVDENDCNISGEKKKLIDISLWTTSQV